MTNQYFDDGDYVALIRDTKANAEAVQAIISAIVAGFDAVPAYEIGNWTPTLIGASVAGTQTYSVQVGRYVKLGKFVQLWGNITLASLDVAAAGNARIGGLPFTSENVANAVYVCHIGALVGVTMGSGRTWPSGRINANSSQIAVLQDPGASQAAIAITAFSGTAAIQFAGSYLAA